MQFKRWQILMSKNNIVRISIIYILLTVATILAYWRVNYSNFIFGDDPLYVTENSRIIHGVTLKTVCWFFTNFYANFWHPLTMISLMLDFQLFGLNPYGYHLTNLLFHTASTLLLFFVLHRMTKAPWKSAFVAALFAVHPLNVESVAWVAERKNVLSTFFWMLTMVAYGFYVEHPRLKTYLITLVLFVMGLMSKPMLVTFPFVMLLLDCWPLQRMRQRKRVIKTGVGLQKPRFWNKRAFESGMHGPSQSIVIDAATGEHKHEWGAILPLIVEKIPFFALIPLFSVLTYIAEGEVVAHSSLSSKISNALVSYVFYIVKAIWPTNLAIFYPLPNLWPLWQTAGSALILCSITVIVILTAKRLPCLAFGWLWFAGTLVPVIGIVQLGNIGRADRFTYVPLIGLFIMVAWGLPELLKGWRYRTEALVVSSALVLSSLSVVTWIQVGYWRDTFTLYNHALEVTRYNYPVYSGRGDAFAKQGNYRLAIEDYNKAIEINPDYAKAYNDRGLAYFKLGDYRQAISNYDTAIEIKPKSAEPYNNRGSAQYVLGDIRQAIADFDKAIEVNPEYEAAYNNRGVAYARLGNNRQAIWNYDKAIRIEPNRAITFNSRGAANAELGNYKKAILDFDRAIELCQENTVAYYSRGIAHAKLGKQEQALQDLKTAARLGSEEAMKILRGQGVSW